MNSLLHGMGLFETMRVARGMPEFLARHMLRMEQSAAWLGLGFTREGFLDALGDGLALCSPDLDYRCRVTLFQDPGPVFNCQVKPLSPQPVTARLCLSGMRVLSGDPLSGHKTTSRLRYHLATQGAESSGFWDGILLNEKGEVAETGRANILAVFGDETVTPPVSAGVLPGIIRGILLEAGAVQERAVRFDDLARSDAVLVSNSLVHIAGVSEIRGVNHAPDEARIREARDRLLGVVETARDCLADAG